MSDLRPAPKNSIHFTFPHALDAVGLRGLGGAGCPENDAKNVFSARLGAIFCEHTAMDLGSGAGEEYRSSKYIFSVGATSNTQELPFGLMPTPTPTPPEILSNAPINATPPLFCSLQAAAVQASGPLLAWCCLRKIRPCGAAPTTS